MSALINIFRIPDLRNKVLFTIGLLVLYRLGTFITIPGVNPYALANARPPGQSLLNVVNVFAGGALFKLSVFSLGIMPYISSSIIINLLTVVIPPLARLQREGEEGRKKINQYTRYGTIVLCAVQAYFILKTSESITNRLGEPLVSQQMPAAYFVALGIITITVGTMFLMWMGEQITERGIGNGVSLIIFAGIVAQLPAMIFQMMNDPTGAVNAFTVIILVIVFIALIAFTVVLTTAVRKVPLQYGKKMQGRRMVQARSQSIPFKLNSANVMPIIFASSLLLFPQTVVEYLGQENASWIGWRVIQEWMNPLNPVVYKQLPYYFIYTALIIFFAYFYTAIQINPQDLAENLKKHGGFVPGIRPGSHTRDYIEFVLNRITLPGAFFLAGLALAPFFVLNLLKLQSNTTVSSLAYTFGGTSLLIIVGVALDTLKQIESQLLMRNYSGFMKKGRIRGRSA